MDGRLHRKRGLVEWINDSNGRNQDGIANRMRRRRIYSLSRIMQDLIQFLAKKSDVFVVNFSLLKVNQRLF